MKNFLASTSFLLPFLGGLFLSANWEMPAWLLDPQLTDWALYALLFLVGMVVGSDTDTLLRVRQMGWKMLLLPLVTLTGTFLGVMVVMPLVPELSVREVLAVASGLGYYSLSSVMISNSYSTILGAIALLSNIMRELATMIFATPISWFFGPVSPICAAGANSMDTTLPFIVRATSPEYAIVSIYHGVCLTFAVPFFVGLSLGI
ncbi:MAG: hypothetical protein CSA97_01120 [Bacteroidetes bacterium]|nr:MAG: hypothetical protein CSA97_01120 [Bacteroidota bacterium]